MTPRLLLATLAVLVLTGCATGDGGGSPAAPASSAPPDLVGTVTQISAPDRVLVEEQPGVQGGRKAWVQADAAGVTVGAAVEVWISGPCAESYPEQCGAARIRLR